MNVAVIGLGLIGGSLAKAIKRSTKHQVYGYDISETTMRLAKEQQVIDGAIDDDLSRMDITIVALYPQATVRFLEKNAHTCRPGSIVIDLCGVKRYVVERVQPLFADTDITFIGGHPMAGMEVWGYICSKETLFDGASMILTPDADTPQDKVQQVSDFFLSIGCGGITLTTPEHHDEVIAYTSQLAHVASSAYILSPAAQQNRGFSAGSYKDLTRVAKLNEHMWTELFLCNGDYLCDELDELIANLGKMRDMIRNGEKEKLCDTLATASERKQALG